MNTVHIRWTASPDSTTLEFSAAPTEAQAQAMIDSYFQPPHWARRTTTGAALDWRHDTANIPGSHVCAIVGPDVEVTYSAFGETRIMQDPTERRSPISGAGLFRR